MARGPDWLANMFVDDPNYVEDSPQFRKLEQQTQKKNLSRAASQALKVVEERTKESAIQTIQQQRQMEQAMTPEPVPLSGPEFFPAPPPEENTPLTPNIPGPSEFDTEPITVGMEHMAPQSPTQPFEDQSPMADQGSPDALQQVQQMSQMLGMDPQQVAAMVLLGKDIQRLNPPPPSAPAESDIPLLGPPDQQVQMPSGNLSPQSPMPAQPSPLLMSPPVS